MYAALGNREKALEYYRNVFSGGLYQSFFKIDPFTDLIRDDPEYKKIEAEARARLEADLQEIRRNMGKPFSWSEVLAKIE